MYELPFGPILSFRGINDRKYLVSALLLRALGNEEPKYACGKCKASSSLIAQVPLSSPTMDVWRLDIEVLQEEVELCVEYIFDGISGCFYVPPSGQAPRIAYASCSGVSDAKYVSLGAQYAERWSNLAESHNRSKYHLLILGGDQIYSDEMLKTKGTPLNDWYEKFSWSRDDEKWTADMEAQADNFFARVYPRYWSRPEILQVLRLVPTLMMWDDHDIMDGWGSYPQKLHESPVHQSLFSIAERYFRIYQQQIGPKEKRPGAITEAGYSFAFSDLGNLAIVVPDLRSERAPDIKAGNKIKPTQVMSQESIKQMFDWIRSLTTKRHAHLLFVSSVPVSFVSLALLENLVGWIPGEIGPEDDFRDHWRHAPHKDERKQIINGLLDFSTESSCKATIVSGDVHVAAASIIRSTNPKHGNRGAEVIYQLISTGIVHPPLDPFAISCLEAITSNSEKIDAGLVAEMLPIAHSGKCLIASRNWLSIEPDDKEDLRARLWVSWHVEGYPHPIKKLIDPVRPERPQSNQGDN
ncbi:metallophosphatase [Pseudomonas tohonis]|uniref:Metallophosphatase n=1 Tax=Pseudomonas tohonis TaxID=2725477 RepID=A0A6J4E5T3_9PSED|nr:alkaline phosphatase D family protein [Pseudomonas tohonis]BCG24324.1 metallophosphatase [Pseudomonas tohonis]GJN56428.1 metallophosphatase [Pseudomonas tohonis]